MTSMIEGQEAERIRIAKDLHDGLGALLSTVKVHFSSIQSEIEAIEKMQVYSKAQEMMDLACEEVRRISHNLMPATLRATGLLSALQQIGDQLQEVHGIQTQLEIQGFEGRIDETKEVFIYRIIQEAANNIIKHAAATKVYIQLFQHAESIQLLIEDNGIGFDRADLNSGLGLKSMESRVQHLNGTMEVDSRIQVGTSLHINIPME